MSKTTISLLLHTHTHMHFLFFKTGSRVEGGEGGSLIRSVLMSETCRFDRGVPLRLLLINYMYLEIHTLQTNDLPKPFDWAWRCLSHSYVFSSAHYH